MARTTFARTVVKTICKVRYVDQFNNVLNAETEMFGDYNEDTAYNACKRALNAKGVIIDEIKHKSYYGKMPLVDFDKYCEKSDYKEW